VILVFLLCPWRFFFAGDSDISTGSVRAKPCH